MTDIAQPFDVAAVTVVLDGGPADLPKALRTQRVSADQQKIKVRYRGGYEHFERERSGGPGTGGTPVLFRWTMRTRIAE